MEEFRTALLHFFLSCLSCHPVIFSFFLNLMTLPENGAPAPAASPKRRQDKKYTCAKRERNSFFFSSHPAAMSHGDLCSFSS
jgi:hypothetical protein